MPTKKQVVNNTIVVIVVVIIAAVVVMALDLLFCFGRDGVLALAQNL